MERSNLVLAKVLGSHCLPTWLCLELTSDGFAGTDTSPGESLTFSYLLTSSYVPSHPPTSLTTHPPPQTMLAGSGAVITKRYTEFAVGGLLSVVIIQGFGYGLIFDLNFFLRNLSVIGGLVMVFTETMLIGKKQFAGLPSISDNDRKK